MQDVQFSVYYVCNFLSTGPVDYLFIYFLKTTLSVFPKLTQPKDTSVTVFTSVFVLSVHISVASIFVCVSELQDLLINQKELSDQLSVDNLLVELQKRGSSGTLSNGEVDEERQ